jgi:hypothetical protein
MLSKGSCDDPRLRMHLYMLALTCGGSFIASFDIKTQRIEKHNNLGIFQVYSWK